MRREHAQPARAARKRTIADRQRSARAQLARVSRKAPYLTSARKRSFRAALGAVALLELLARAAPARVVASDVLAVGLDDRLRRAGGRGRAAGDRHRRGARGAATRGGDRIRAGEGFVLVLHPAAVGTLLSALELIRLFRRELRVEERQHDLLVDRDAELPEHDVALVLVLDERVLLRHRTQVDALAQVIHSVQVLAPALVDDLEDHETLELTHQLGRQLLLLRGVRVAGVVLELLEERVARDLAEILAQLVDGDFRVVEQRHLLDEPLEVPFLGVLLRGELVDGALDHLVDPLEHLLVHVLAFEDIAALFVDDHALPVHDVVVLEDVLARDEVLLLDLLLRALDLVREDLRLHRLVLGNLEALHDVLDPVAGEQPHQVVLAGQVEAGLAGVALAAGAPAQLVVDAARLVALRPEHVEAADLADAVAELDVDAAAGHVGGDRDGALQSGVLDDLRLACVLLRIEDIVRNALPREQLAQVLGRLDGDRADQHGLALLVPFLDVAHDGDELPLLRLEDQVVLVVALVQRLCLERLVQVVDELRVARVVQALDAERAFGGVDRRLPGRDGLVLLVVLVVRVRVAALEQRVVRDPREPAGDAREVVVDLRSRLRLAGAEQRWARP